MENIRKIKVFGELDEQALSLVDSKIHWNVYPKGLSIIAQREMSTDVYFIASGLVKATTYSILGREIAYQDLEAGDMFGEISCIDKLDRTTSVVVTKDSLIGKMTSKDFWSLLEVYPTLKNSVMLRLTGIIRFLCSRIYEYGALTVSERIRAEIIRLSRENDTGNNRAEISNMPTHLEIANKLATHREAVTKELNFLVKQGYLEKGKDILIVPDIEKLDKLIEC